MDQYIAEPDDPRQIGDCRRKIRSDPPQADKRLANDFELALDRGPQHNVGQIIIETAAGCEICYALRRALRIPKIARSPVRDHDSGNTDRRSASMLRRK